MGPTSKKGLFSQSAATRCISIPPYWPVSKTANFTAYSVGGFGSEDQERLRDVAARLVKKGVHVLLSNADVPEVRKLYKGFKIEKIVALGA